MNNENLINKSSLSEDDKELLKTIISANKYPKDIYKLSIFSKLGISKKINGFLISYSQCNSRRRRIMRGIHGILKGCQKQPNFL